MNFFSNSYPKSLDKFTFSDFLLNEDFTSLNINDALATLNEITVQTILKSLTILPEKTIFNCHNGRWCQKSLLV